MKKNYNSFVAVLLLTVALFVLLSGQMLPKSADAATVIGYQTIVADAGATAYTETTYTSAYLAGAFGDVVVQVNLVSTGTITVTPQFSNEMLGCGSVTDWADATISQVDVTRISTNTDSVAFGVHAVSKAVTSGGSTLIGFPAQGRCMRVKMTNAETFTPTVYIRMANTQQ